MGWYISWNFHLKCLKKEKMMNTVRKPVVAGLFYPSSAQELQTLVNKYLKEIKPLTAPAPKAIIVPHAGYIYSGPIAASVYARLNPNSIKKVILLGPSHRVPLRGLAASSMTTFATPLGNIPVDKETIDKLLNLPQVSIFEPAHSNEHSLEVQLPFLQTVLNEFTLIPLVVGETTPEQVGEVLEKLWGGKETLIVISSDLSHYQDYKTAQQMDKLTSQAIENLCSEDISYKQACGYFPIQGLLHLAKKLGMQAKTVDLRNSGDTAGQKDQVVGYGAYVFN
jgi:AmmeMemoRadiSam system protein B